MTYDHDPESRGTSGSRTPLLGSSSHQRLSQERDDGRWTALRIMQFFGGGIFVADPTTYDPLELLLNEENSDQRHDLTVKWRDHKLKELNFVGVVAALLAGVLTSTGSWPNILPNGKASPWSVRTSWYCGIVLSLFSILTAADQTVRLHRLSSHQDGINHIYKMLSKTNGERKHSTKTGRRTPSILQIMTWQMPVMFLTSGTICMIVGMFIHVWSATTHLHYPSLWDDNTKVAVTFTCVAITAIVLFFIGQVSLYSPLRR